MECKNKALDRLYTFILEWLRSISCWKLCFLQKGSMFLLHGLEAPGSPDNSTTATICGFGHPSLKLVNFSRPTLREEKIPRSTDKFCSCSKLWKFPAWGWSLKRLGYLQLQISHWIPRWNFSPRYQKIKTDTPASLSRKWGFGSLKQAWFIRCQLE